MQQFQEQYRSPYAPMIRQLITLAIIQAIANVGFILAAIVSLAVNAN